MDTMTSLLTTEQVATRVGKTVSTVNRWANDGRLVPDFEVPGYRGQRLYSPSTVLAFLNGDSSDESSD